VGDPAPSFALPAVGGSEFAFERGPALLVFFRGHWCAICRKQLRSLQADLETLRAAGVALIAISSDGVAESTQLAKKLELEFPVLSDTQLSVIRGYRVEDLGNEIAAPSTVVVDEAGIIRWIHVGDSAMDRPRLEQVIEVATCVASGGSRDCS